MEPQVGEVTAYEDLFPAKLHYLIELLEDDGISDVISWQPHGKAFLVKDQKKFVAEYLPKYVLKCPLCL
jgi:HSF-type DNA-binding